MMNWWARHIVTTIVFVNGMISSAQKIVDPSILPMSRNDTCWSPQKRSGINLGHGLNDEDIILLRYNPPSAGTSKSSLEKGKQSEPKQFISSSFEFSLTRKIHAKIPTLTPVFQHWQLNFIIIGLPSSPSFSWGKPSHPNESLKQSKLWHSPYPYWGHPNPMENGRPLKDFWSKGKSWKVVKNEEFLLGGEKSRWNQVMSLISCEILKPLGV